MRDLGRRERRSITQQQERVLKRGLNMFALLCMVVLLVVLHQANSVTWAVQLLNILAGGVVVVLVIEFVLSFLTDRR